MRCREIVRYRIGDAVAPAVVARAAALSAAIGGVGNIAHVESCALTRLRIELRDGRSVDQAELVSAGAMGLLRVSDDVVHVIVGEDAPHLARAMVAKMER